MLIGLRTKSDKNKIQGQKKKKEQNVETKSAFIPIKNLGFKPPTPKINSCLGLMCKSNHYETDIIG